MQNLRCGKAEFSPGFQTELEYKRSFEPLFGFSVGAKFYEINKVYDLPSASLFSAAGAPVLTANQLRHHAFGTKRWKK